MLRARAAAALLVALFAAGCGGGSEDPHARVACAGCHRGVAADTGRAAVTASGCDRRGCHPDAGPESVRVAMVKLRHRAHGDSGAAVPCATCHTHRPGEATMVAVTGACALCHVDAIADPRRPACATCHPNPRHQRATSQGVPIAHAEIQDARVPCTRCHYRLLDGRPDSVTAGCAACHRDPAATRPVMALLDSLRPRRPAVGLDTAGRRAGGAGARLVALEDTLHARHRGYSCGSCHAPVRHRVVAMSTSVALQCADCHAGRHRRPIPVDTIATARCDDCHAGVHAEEQRLILGLLPDEPIRPSPMFMGGVTCRSCHVVPGSQGPRAGTSLVANELSCTGCHGPQWAGVLARWRRGYQRRDGWVGEYVAAAARALADSTRRAAADTARVPASARAKVRRAEALLVFLGAAGPLHNLPAADRIMRDALRLTADAYASAGLAVPDVPALGPPVEAGSCISCHYGIEEAAAGLDTATGRRFTHGDHLLRAGLRCDACHAAGAAPPGIPESLWIDTTRGRRDDGGSRRE